MVDEGAPAEVKLEIQIPSSKKTEIRTRSGVTDPETVIEKLEVFIFSGTSLQERVTVNAVDIDGEGTTKTVRLKLTQVANCNMYAYANTGTLLSGTITSLSDIESALTGITSDPASPFMMGGALTGIDIPSAISVSIPMYRNVAKITATDGRSSKDPIFLLSKISLYKAPDRGTLNHTGSYSVPSGVNYNKTYTSGSVSDGIYTYEAQAANAYLIMEATYNGSPSFYKVDFRDNDASINLQRNHHYTVNVVKVEGPGYSTAADAAAASYSNIVVEIIDEVEEIVDMITNGQYELGVSDTLWIDSFEGASAIATVMLNSSTGLKLPASLSVDYDETSILDVLSTQVSDPTVWTAISETDVVKKYNYQVVLSENPTDKERVRRITFSAGNLSRTLVIVQKSTDFMTGRTVYMDRGTGYDLSKTYWTFLENDVNGLTRPDGLHFNVVYSPVYRYKIDVSQSALVTWTDLSGRLSITRSGTELIVELASTTFEEPWMSELILHHTFSDATPSRDEHFPVFRTGLFANETATNQVSSTPKVGIFYYEIIKLGSEYWLDRNLGASSNGFYSMSTTTHDDQDSRAVGGYYRIKDAGSLAESVLPLCPTGFKVPSQQQFTNLHANGYLSMESKTTANGDTYWVAVLKSDPQSSSISGYFPMGGYMQNGTVKGNGGGYYWTSTFAYEGQGTAYNDLALEHKFWQRRLNILTSNPQFLSDRIVDGSNGGSLGQYKGMSIRCVKE